LGEIMLTSDSVGSFFLALLAAALSLALYISGERAPTKERTYIYSPTASPTERTPKRTFEALAGAFALTFASFGFLDYLHPPHPVGTSAISAQAMQVLDPLAQLSRWIAVAALVGSLGLLVWTTRPLEDDIPETSTHPTSTHPNEEHIE